MNSRFSDKTVSIGTVNVSNKNNLSKIHRKENFLINEFLLIINKKTKTARKYNEGLKKQKRLTRLQIVQKQQQ
jgi:hypothetical protein